MPVASNRADRRRKGEEKRFRQARHHSTAFRPETGGTPAHASKGHRGTGKVLCRRYAAEQGLKCLFAAGFPPGEGENSSCLPVTTGWVKWPASQGWSPGKHLLSGTPIERYAGIPAAAEMPPASGKGGKTMSTITIQFPKFLRSMETRCVVCGRRTVMYLEKTCPRCGKRSEEHTSELQSH